MSSLNTIIGFFPFGGYTNNVCVLDFCFPNSTSSFSNTESASPSFPPFSFLLDSTSSGFSAAFDGDISTIAVDVINFSISLPISPFSFSFSLGTALDIDSRVLYLRTFVRFTLASFSETAVSSVIRLSSVCGITYLLLGSCIFTELSITTTS
ncbi:hypothetical protein AX774_g2710 [Zancudomyces culisetae]|uniref:Uncharacterized protein n=1 Tax=Zancudomyces culisetae TaxID=1213189 RepID=A0A1R1PS51_ZANCU|nr:hypothetical protein AX774_g2710 [Zancudomyces culisetae]|eukprot:OMH83784.1 hypothetical protein AX774_g2710 [Zancudomyces culisetae]